MCSQILVVIGVILLVGGIAWGTIALTAHDRSCAAKGIFLLDDKCAKGR